MTIYAAAHSQQCTAVRAGNIVVIGWEQGTFRYGRVSICNGSEWRTVCNTNWGMTDTAVVCRELGYPTEGWFE